MPGGVADYTYHLSRALPAEAVRTVVLTSDDKEVLKHSGVEVLPEVRRWNAFGALTILRKIRGVRPDVVNLHYVPYAFNHYGVPLHVAALAVAIRALGPRLVTTFHEVGTRFQWNRPKYWGIVLLQRFIACVLGLASSQIIVVVGGYRRMLHRFQRKTHCIPVGSNFLPLAVSEEERRGLRRGIAPEGETILATFAGGPWYRPEMVLRAAKVLLDSHGTALKVLVLGSQGNAVLPGGRTLQGIAADLGIQNHLQITGYLPEREVFRLLAAADLYVLLDMGVHGGISAKSTALVAAYAAGLPVVGNRGALTGGLFVDGVNIDLVDSGDAKHLAPALLRLIDDPDRRERLAEGGRRSYRKHFAWERIAAAYLRALSGKAPEGAEHEMPRTP